MAFADVPVLDMDSEVALPHAHLGSLWPAPIQSLSIHIYTYIYIYICIHTY